MKILMEVGSSHLLIDCLKEDANAVLDTLINHSMVVSLNREYDKPTRVYQDPSYPSLYGVEIKVLPDNLSGYILDMTTKPASTAKLDAENK